ncbi:MAG TPA: hypothetical protein VFY48_08495 [Solirubrobacterales bacterium]|nr:hypothetical protein [Solirubrobacterales bacterium]
MTPQIEVGSVLRETFAIYRERAGVLLPVAFWLFLAVGIVEELAYAYIVTAILAGLLGMAATIVYQGMVVQVVRDRREGRRESSAGGMLGSVRPVLLSLVAASLLAAVGTGLGFLLLVIPGLIAVTFWAVIAPAIVTERTGPLKAFGRSQDLVGGNAWPVFGAVLLGLLVVAVPAVASLLLAELLIGYGILIRVVFFALVGAFAAPVPGLVAAILYFRLREIEEASASAVVEQPGHGQG